MAQNDLWNKLYKRLKDVSVAAADFAEEQALIGKLKFEILTLKNKIDRINRDIGARVVELSRLSQPPSAYNDPDVRLWIDDIWTLNEQIEEKRTEITRVSEMFRARAAAHQDRKRRDEGAHPKPAAAEPPSAKPKSTAKKPTVKKNAKPEGKTPTGEDDKVETG